MIRKKFFRKSIKKPNKFGNHKITVGGFTYDSKKEAKRAFELYLMERAGEIRDLQKQVKFSLLKTFKDNQGKTERGINYTPDFVYFEGKYRVAEDVKSPITKKEKSYIIKRKLFKITYAEIIFREV